MYYKVVATYVGSIIGAGFASGQEIMQFYIKFGKYGLLGVLISTMLFAYLGALVLYLSSRLGTSGYGKLFTHVLGNKLDKVMDVLSILMLAGGLGIMLAGSGAVFQEHLGLSKNLGIILAAVVTCVVICAGLQGVLTINAWLLPIKLIVLTVVCIWALTHTGLISQPDVKVIPPASDKLTGNWFLAGILYVSYNMIIPIAVLSSLGKTINQRVGITCGIIGGITLGTIAAIITIAGLTFYPHITQYQVPLLYLAQQAGPVWQKLLALLIWIAILTTAIANAHGFTSRLAEPNSKKYKFVGVGLVIAILPLAGVEFTQLIKNVYPMFGYAGLLLVGALLFRPFLWRSRI